MSPAEEIRQRRAEWCKALLELKDQQGVMSLVSETEPPRYCVLGVAAKVLGTLAHGRVTLFTSELDQLGLTGMMAADLMRMNDDDGLSFPELVKVIEALPIPRRLM